VRIEFIANAGFVVTLADGRTLVTDPWLTGGAYYGSWYNYPPVPETVVARVRSLTPDWVYVSHVHPDHLDPDTLRWFPGASILIGDLGHQHLRRAVMAAGAARVLEMPLDVTSDLGDGVEVTVLPQFAAAGGGFVDEVGYMIDTSLALRDFDGTLLLHVVDNSMSVDDALAFVDRFGHPDIAIVPYSGASLYPHAFAYSPDDKDARTAALRERTVREFLDVTEALAPRMIVPAAGSYVMGGAIASYSRWLHQATPEQLRAAWAERGPDESICFVYMAPGDTIDSGAVPTRPYPVANFSADDRISYALSLASRPLAHEHITVPSAFGVPWLRLLTRARANLWAVQVARDLHPPVDVEIRLASSTRVRCDGVTFRWALNAEQPGALNDACVVFTLDPALMLMVLVGAAVWNNIEIGALVQVERHPDEYIPTVHSLMSYFTLV